jgi:hypothetical protein
LSRRFPGTACSSVQPEESIPLTVQTFAHRPGALRPEPAEDQR